VLDQLKEFLDTALGRISGKSTLAQAIRYASGKRQPLAACRCGDECGKITGA
jgi:hypothetical protein